MTLQEVKANQDKFLNAVYSLAWENEAFKQQLISDPVDTIKKATDGAVDLTGKKVQVNDQTDSSTLYLNIPQNPKNMTIPEDVELTEKELEVVAGGGLLQFAEWLLGIEVSAEVTVKIP